MEQVQLNQVNDAHHLVVGLKPHDDGSHTVMVGVQDDQENWLVYGANAAEAREIAQSLIDGADMVEGKKEIA